MEVIPMVDLKAQYAPLKSEIDIALHQCLQDAQFIGGKQVKLFEDKLAGYLGIKQVVSCGNGTDALQIALMALDLPRGSKIIVPAFTYIAPLEVIRLLGFTPVYADVDPDTFNITRENIEKVYTEGVRAIIVVHLFGRPCIMDEISGFAKEKQLYIIEDNAQSLGSEKNITRDHLITTSFFPSKNLGAYGDGGAILCNNIELAERCRMIANHGQEQKYYHDVIGINSRLDSIQAAILNIKLNYLDVWIASRKRIASLYHEQLKNIPVLKLPDSHSENNSTFHQYTIQVPSSLRADLQKYLSDKGIATMVYYPIPGYQQKAYLEKDIRLPITEKLCTAVLSLPIYPEMTPNQLLYICRQISTFFKSSV